jgi:predicted unusual protein kinase regulating ubiquinone biosynthesis (AarF/ABC1/UbiB family)
MGISLKPKHLKRYKDIAWLFMKYGRTSLVKNAGLEAALDENEGACVQKADPKAAELADDLEKLGPTFVKLGQLLSTRPDFLPQPYIEALSRLQDKVEPFSYEEVERIISDELGVRISNAFSNFDSVPIAAASLGQVHRASLRDGRPVAVKVQRPAIRERITEDLAALEEIAEFFDKHTEMGRRYEFRRILEDFRKSLLRELDYRQEAHNLTILGENLKDFDRIVIPSPVDDYTTSRVLTMDYIRGKKVTSLGPLARMEMDGGAPAEQLFKAYLKQVIVDGFFHADPHPGNVFLTNDGRIALIDLGMTARVAPAMQEKLLKFLLAISEGRADDAAAISIEMGEPRDDFDKAEFSRRVVDLVGSQQDARIEQIDVGRLVLEVTRLSGECGMRPPHDLTMLGKTLLNLDQVGRALDPKFDPNAAVRRNAAEIMQQRMWKSVSPANLFSSVLEVKDFFAKLPGRAGKIMDALASNEFEIKVDTIDEKQLMEGFQKVANRITLGLVLAAMIVAAALLMRVETSFRIFSYPGFAIILFLLATAGGAALVLHILFHDQQKKP